MNAQCISDPDYLEKIRLCHDAAAGSLAGIQTITGFDAVFTSVQDPLINNLMQAYWNLSNRKHIRHIYCPASQRVEYWKALTPENFNRSQYLDMLKADFEILVFLNSLGVINEDMLNLPCEIANRVILFNDSFANLTKQGEKENYIVVTMYSSILNDFPLAVQSKLIYAAYNAVNAFAYVNRVGDPALIPILDEIKQHAGFFEGRFVKLFGSQLLELDQVYADKLVAYEQCGVTDDQLM